MAGWGAADGLFKGKGVLGGSKHERSPGACLTNDPPPFATGPVSVLDGMNPERTLVAKRPRGHAAHTREPSVQSGRRNSMMVAGNVSRFVALPCCQEPGAGEVPCRSAPIFSSFS